MTSVARGRPLASSRETLADAASELFLEQGYDATTVVDITKRAGVSRSSFFNYFDGKAATIWYALDEHLDRFCGPEADHDAFSVAALAAALGDAPPHTLALAITNAEVMGVAEELTTGRALRQSALGAALAADLCRRDRSRAMFLCEIAGAAQAAAVFAAIWRWAALGAGTHRADAEITAALAAVPEAPRAGGSALRVAVIGAGAIGSRVIEQLATGRVAGTVLAGVVTRRPDALSETVGALATGITDFGDDLAGAIAASDLVVECAGIGAAREFGTQVIAAGRDLLLVSIGALADEATRAALVEGPGVLRLASGAIGGLDILASAARPGGIPGGIARASITSTKEATSLVQPWMGEQEASRLRSTTEAFTLFEGSVAEAVELYPGSLNVACALAHATALWDEVRVQLVADPGADRTIHEISASGSAGDYRFVMTNAVSEANPTSSAVVAESVLRGIGEIARPNRSFA
ncbi:aspartate dehydrogenase domain-containing protein [Leucobacter sp. G161]|uniref:aspartate dehydrogenase domain-containing protein n=1 Tax=Leucobacter sp. G161 TaxID=663704 RepID=UPI0009F88B80|nr:aspartate dehydrogenase domain-containing protein [Leucobacter sp. G161]